MKLTSVLQLVDTFQQAVKINNLIASSLHVAFFAVYLVGVSYLTKKETQNVNKTSNYIYEHVCHMKIFLLY